MNEYCDLSPAERELLALVRSEAEYEVTISRLMGVSSVKKAYVREQSAVQCQSSTFDAAWYCVHQERGSDLRVIEGGRAHG